jgi:rhodanese-related sulfurtransferase
MFRDSQNISSRTKLKLVENLSAEAFLQKLNEDDDAVLIDVRTELENQTARIPISLLIDYRSPAFIMELNKLDRSKNYYLYCRSGNRSYHAGNQMLQMGFETVYNLQPGIIGWKGITEQDRKFKGTIILFPKILNSLLVLYRLSFNWKRCV